MLDIIENIDLIIPISSEKQLFQINFVLLPPALYYGVLSKF